MLKAHCKFTAIKLNSNKNSEMSKRFEFTGKKFV